LFLLLYLGCTTDQRSTPFGYLHLLVGPSWSSSIFSGFFIAEEVDGVGDKGSRDITTVDVQTLLRLF
jgi:hypothetical protein